MHAAFRRVFGQRSHRGYGRGQRVDKYTRGRLARRIALTLICWPLLAVQALPLTAAATPATPTCGSVITASVTLSSDLDCTAQDSGNALTIGAADVTVDLNGHVIMATSNVTVIEDVGYNRLTVENGAIDVSTSSGVAFGILVQGSTNPNGNQTPVERPTIRRVTLMNSGIALDDARNSYVADNVLSSSFLTISADTSDIIANNHLTVPSGSTGIDVDGTTNEVIRGNTIRGIGRGATGIVDYYSGGQITTRNVLNDLATGIFESDIDGVVSYNRGVHNTRGIDEEGAVGIEYVGNHFDWGRYGIILYDPDGTQLTRNITNHNTETGVFIYVDGAYCGSPGFPCAATLTQNVANDNARGLYSQIKTSGYGNRAANNAIVDCHKVSCVHTTT